MSYFTFLTSRDREGLAALPCATRWVAQKGQSSVLEFRICRPFPGVSFPDAPSSPHRIRRCHLPRHGPGKLAAMQPAQFRSAFYLPLIAAWRWRQPIIFSDADRDLFVETPAEACALAKFKTYAKVAPRGF